LNRQLKVAIYGNDMSVQFADGSKPSVQELASFASRATEISIGGDDIVELGDDLGIGLLANQNKIATSPKAPTPRQIAINTGGSSMSEIPQIDIRPIDDIGIVDLDAAPSAGDIHINRAPEPAPFVINTVGGGEVVHSSGSGMNPEQEHKEKQRLITKLRRLEQEGMKGSRMTMTNSYEEIKQEYDMLTDSKGLEASIRFQRNAMMTFVSGVEMVNDKFGNKLPVKPRLKGWSESVHTNIGDFDDIFEELYDLYKDKAKMHPLMRLVGTLGVSATMYHLTNSMAERSGVPGMSDLLNDNPELQRQFAAAMAAKMGGGLGNFMSAASGFPSAAGPSPVNGPAPMGMGVPPPSPPRGGMSGRSPFNNSAAAEEASAGSRVRREMRGPTGVDDILKAFESERLVQQNPVSSQHAGIFSPSGPPPVQSGGVHVLREGVGGPMDPLGDFAVDDIGSIGSGSTMNTERRRGRRRAVAAPAGEVLNINI
jgi:hypothetical protein